MALNNQQQFFELINQVTNILICFAPQKRADGLAIDEPAAALALGILIEKMGKKATVVAEDFIFGQRMSFFDGWNKIEPALRNTRQFVVAVDLKGKKINEFSYDVKDENLLIYLLPDKGEIRKEEVTVKDENYRFDAIIVLGAPDLESLGMIFKEQKELFFAKPIINIDNDPANENYGQINLIDQKAGAVSEIIYELINYFESNLITKEIATILLAGIIDQTESFKKINLTPKTLFVASELVSYGADKEKIVNSLYRTKKMATLKLWGRVLARLQFERSLGLIWSAVPLGDFIKTGAEVGEIDGLIEEMISKSPMAKAAVLLYETVEGEVKGQLWHAQGKAKILAELWQPKGTNDLVYFSLPNKNLTQAEAEVMGAVKRGLENFITL
ncbi:MAG TPA: hypothetical protein PKZ16_01860 [bacterium]|nr:hypothetical protein [bacterium]HPL95799.1 hypothetical protein [bacterium]